jgi:hypothetical protein
LRVTGSGGDKRFRVRYLHAGRDVTRQVLAGTCRTGALRPGSSYLLTVVVRRTSHASSGDRRVLTVSASSTSPGAAHDAVAIVARATP